MDLSSVSNKRIGKRLGRYRKYKKQSASLLSGSPAVAVDNGSEWDVYIKGMLSELAVRGEDGDVEALRILKRNGGVPVEA